MQSLFSTPLMRVLGGLVLAMVLIALVSYASLNFERIKHLDHTTATISVVGMGEVVAVPDTGQFTFSVQAEADTAEAAQAQSATAINDIVAFLGESGVAETDIKTTNYNLYPRYRWEDEVCAPGTSCRGSQRVADGFEVSQSITVKVRAVEDATGIITGVGERGATNISGLDFVVDDAEALQVEARSAAIEDARAQASQLAKDLNVRIVRMVGFAESHSGYEPPVTFMARSEMMDEESTFGGAVLPTGEDTTTAHVTITYEVR